MRKYSICLTFLFCLLTTANAEFSAFGGSKGIPFVVQPGSATGLDKIFLYDSSNNAVIKFEINSPNEWTWYKYKDNPSNAIKVELKDLITEPTNTQLIKVELDWGYFIQSNSGMRRFIYVVGYVAPAYKSIDFVSTDNSCSEVVLKINADLKDLEYYTYTGERRILNREMSVRWNTSEWDIQSGTYITKPMFQTFLDIKSNLFLPAPLTDTYFILTGDKFSDYFGINSEFTSGLYKAVAVKTNAGAFVNERDNLNETGKTSGELAGSAPLDVSFKSNSSDAVTLTEWYILKPNDNSGSFLRFTDENLNYSFKEFGTYTVKHFVSNSVCKDSAIFNIKVSDSFLDCPNFFTPRSSPGENDEFRVAYRSIVSFKGVIVNRWGNTIFQWDDPAKGWDGKYKGKPVSPGVYFYVIQAKGSDGIEYLKRGDINLLE